MKMHMPGRRMRIAAVLLVLTGIALATYLMLDPGHDETDHAADVYYTCPMHPTVVSDRPGKCPICHMDLVPRQKSPQAAEGNTPLAQDQRLKQIAVSPAERILANVQTVTVGRGTIENPLDLTGRFVVAENALRTISAPAGGRIEELLVTYTGASVRRGQPIMRIYSPELLTAREELRSAINMRNDLQGAGNDTRARAEELVAAARRRLQLLGISPGQIDQMERGGGPSGSVTVSSTASGTVQQKLVQSGQYVSQGQALFTVVPLDVVWVEADVYEQDLSSVRIGQTMSIRTPALPEQALTARVEFIGPSVAGNTRTTVVRGTVPSRSGLLKPGMFAEVRLLAGGSTQNNSIMVPASALLESGRTAVVWVEISDGTFAPREVTIGRRTAQGVEVLGGLSNGERVAVSGVFLLDSEAQLRAVAPGANQN